MTSRVHIRLLAFVNEQVEEMIERLTHPEVEQKMLDVLIAGDVGATKKRKKEKNHEKEEGSSEEEVEKNNDNDDDDDDDGDDDGDGDPEGSSSFRDEHGVRNWFWSQIGNNLLVRRKQKKLF
jgi:hypothetical protein